MNQRMGILGIGTYLPPIVRKNDWWPEEIVSVWRERQARSITRAQEEPSDPPTEGMRATLKAMAAYKSDPFEGAVERRVMPDDMKTSDMDVAAAREAIARSGIDSTQIDLVLAQTSGPNYVHVPNACLVHKELELSAHCLAISTEGMCNAFQQQLALAEQMIVSGRVRYALLIQSCNMTQFCRPQDPFSAWFGDGATAVIVGPAAAGRGVLGSAHCTDGSVYGSIVSGIPGKRWWDEGRVVSYLEDAAGARLQFLLIAETAKPLLDRALADAGLERSDIKLWACHQASAWLPRATQEFLGLEHAHRVETFPWAGSLSGANLPLVLSVAEREGLVHDGDVVALFSGAAGMQVSATVLRWGR